MRLDFNEQKRSINYRRRIYEDYLSSVGKYIQYADSKAQKEYGKSYPLALVYFPDELTQSLKDINMFLTHENFEYATLELEKISPVIKSILKQP